MALKIWQTALEPGTATKIAGLSLDRRYLAVKNHDQQHTAYIGPSPRLTSGTGRALAPNECVELEGDESIWALYGTASAPLRVGVIEITEDATPAAQEAEAMEVV